MGAKKKGGKKKAASDGEGAPSAAQAAANASLVQAFDVQAAQETIRRLEDQNLELCDKVKALKQELEQTKADQADVYIYLHKKLDDNFDVIAGLESHLLDVTTEKERQETAKQKAVAMMQSTYDRDMVAMRAKVESLEDQLASLQEFKAKRDEIEAATATLRQQLEDEQQRHEQKLQELERQNVAEKDRLKKEMFLKIKETKQSILESTNDQLDAATKRTMAENEQMTTELQYQSRETERLLTRNSELSKQNAALKRDAELAAQAQEELVKRTHFYQRLIKKLHDRIRAIEGDKASLPQLSLMEDSKYSVETSDASRAEVDALRAELYNAREAAEHAAADARHSVQQYERVIQLQDETTKFLLLAMADVKQQMANTMEVQTRQDRTMPMRLDHLSPTLREKALRLLLAKLQLYQTSLWAGTGLETTADQVTAPTPPLPPSSVSLPRIGRSTSPRAERTEPRRSSAAMDGNGPETLDADAEVRKSIGIQAEPPPKEVFYGYASSTTIEPRVSPIGDESPKARAHVFKASTLRGSSSTAMHPVPVEVTVTDNKPRTFQRANRAYRPAPVPSPGLAQSSVGSDASMFMTPISITGLKK